MSFARPHPTWESLPANLRGALWMIAAAVILTIMGALVKHLGRELHTFQIAFFRCLIAVVFMLPFIARAGIRSLVTRRPVLHLLRTAMGISAMFCVFYAFSHMPFAEAMAIVFSRPLFSVTLAAVLLGETVGWHRAGGAVIGFLGVVMMVKPGTAAFDPVSLVAVAAALLGGGVAIVVKKLSSTETTTTIVMWFAIGGTIISFIPMLFVWSPPTLEQWGLLVLIGVFGVAGQATLTRAFSTGETSFVAPFDYTRLVIATLMGLLIFHEVPDPWAVIGAVVIVGSSLYIARRELGNGRKGASREASTPISS